MDDLKYQIDLLTALNDKLLNSERIYRLVSEFSGNVFLYFDYRKNGSVELVGPWDELVGDRISNHPFDERYMMSLIHDEDQKQFRDVILEMEDRRETTAKVEFRSKTKKYWIECEARVHYGESGNLVDKIIAFRDITKIKARNEELIYFAYYDSLTGLYNRNYFVKSLRDMCERAENEQVGIELLFLDIDDFKKVNDSLGLLFGDELVQDFAAFIKEFQNENVIAGRFGSDVFCVAVYHPYGQRCADHIYRSIRERLRRPFILTNKAEIIFSVSAGVAEFPEAGRTALELIKNAEIVLFNAKEKGKNNIQYFEHTILQDFIKTVSLEQRLKEAIENEDFIIYFQPQFSAKTGRLRGAEALLRWPGENGSFITSPAEFIPIAEKNGAIIPIGSWVLKESIRVMNLWKAKYHFPMIVSVNISAIQLEKDNFVDYVQHLLTSNEINPEWLELEITESVFINDFDKAITKINTLRKLGIKISLDDFGTGYSSLSYLKALPIDTLKIDKSFIDTAIKDASTNIITESVVSMVRKLGFETIAEGVETEDQFEYLKKIQCDSVQGYLFGRPMSRTDFEKLIVRQLA
ncbi:MAG: EAL domain-containing protein [Lachnospiraceae bacterium]